ncbi:MAG: hypothetical protein CL927_00140 [Deltaproteobacteria bacterium]|nr:hypothetical protein [Deltaproteobacteria bacterium]HCH62532.1 hypothetical protein [Deltaproteobacteria bacterium]
MNRALFTLAALTITTGCHGKYKRNANALGKVSVTVRAPANPEVVVGGPSLDVDTDGEITKAERAQQAAQAGVQVASVMLGTKAQKKLDRAVSSNEARAALKVAFMEDVDSQPLPYTVGEKGKSRLTIEITDFGLDATSGQPMAFIRTRTTIHNRKGDRVYRATETCTRTLGPGMDIPFSGADELVAVKQLADLSPKRMEKVVTAVVEQCAEEVSAELVSHL